MGYTGKKPSLLMVTKGDRVGFLFGFAGLWSVGLFHFSGSGAETLLKPRCYL